MLKEEVFLHTTMLKMHIHTSRSFILQFRKGCVTHSCIVKLDLDIPRLFCQCLLIRLFFTFTLRNTRTTHLSLFLQEVWKQKLILFQKFPFHNRVFIFYFYRRFLRSLRRGKVCYTFRTNSILHRKPG